LRASLEVLCRRADNKQLAPHQPKSSFAATATTLSGHISVASNATFRYYDWIRSCLSPCPARMRFLRARLQLPPKSIEHRPLRIRCDSTQRREPGKTSAQKHSQRHNHQKPFLPESASTRDSDFESSLPNIDPSRPKQLQDRVQNPRITTKELPTTWTPSQEQKNKRLLTIVLSMPKTASCFCTQEAGFATVDHRVNAGKP
jgi:hypothetical protein